MFNRRTILCAMFSLALVPQVRAAESAAGWLPLFNGKNLDGWRVSENPDSVKVKDGTIACEGPRAHAFYQGSVRGANFKNFELKLEFKPMPGANSGVFFHTEYQEKGWPNKGYEVQIDNSQQKHGDYYEFKKTGSLYGVRNIYKPMTKDGEWSTMHVVVRGKRITIRINDELLVDYTEPAEPVRVGRRETRLLSSGTFALQCHDPDSKAYFRNIMVKPLPDDLPSVPGKISIDAAKYDKLVRLHLRNFPVIDLHAHLKGGLTVDDILEKMWATGINYGIAVNCGVGFPITNDQGIYDFLKNTKRGPYFLAMQAEGREWVNMFSKDAISKFDYVFSDAMTFTDRQGRRTRLWMPKEVHVTDKQDFMDMYVEKIVGVISDEPINIYVNPTFLPAVIADEYDALWTPERMKKVIDAAVKHDVAIEINARYRLPSPAFIKAAKKAGVKFSFGTNNGGRDDLGTLDYCIEMIDECGLTADDLFLPKAARPALNDKHE